VAAVSQQPGPRVIQQMSHMNYINNRKSLCRVRSAAVVREQVEPSCTLGNKAKRLAVI
jgi:hypothetical protein